MAALVAHTASSQRSFNSFCSASELPPTYRIPTPPFNRTNLSFSTLFTSSVWGSSNCCSIDLILFSRFPLPLIMVVESWVIVIFSAFPIDRIFSGLPPIEIIKSSNTSFLVSPNPGERIAAILSLFCSLLTVKVLITSDS